jgi:hypothetical protein
VLGVPPLYADPTVNAAEVLEARRLGVTVRELIDSGRAQHTSWLGSMRQASALMLRLSSARADRAGSMRAVRISVHSPPTTALELAAASAAAGMDGAANPLASKRYSVAPSPVVTVAASRSPPSAWSRVPLYDYAVVSGLLLADPRAVHHFVFRPPPPVTAVTASPFSLQPMPTGAWAAVPSITPAGVSNGGTTGNGSGGAGGGGGVHLDAMSGGGGGGVPTAHIAALPLSSSALSGSTSGGGGGGDRAASASEVVPKVAPSGSSSPAAVSSAGSRIAGRSMRASPAASSALMSGAVGGVGGSAPLPLVAPAAVPVAGAAPAAVGDLANGRAGVAVPTLHPAASEQAMDPGIVLTGRDGSEEGDVGGVV